MNEKFIKTPVKGMCDMLPSDMRLRESVLSMIKKTYGSYGFMQIETPAMEHIENLTSNQGGDNEKLIFKVLKRGASLERAISSGEELADNGLRYDLTLPLARFYANNKEKLPSPFKALQIGSVWRADNPQKGRFRQFTQCDIDILGDDSSLAEIELILATSGMLSQIFQTAGLKGFTVHINDRRILTGAVLAAGFKKEQVGSVLISLDKLDKIGIEKVKEELIEGGCSQEAASGYLSLYENAGEGLSVEEFCKNISAKYLSADAVSGLMEIMDCVKNQLPEGVKLVFDPTLVRGMGYYTGTIFEVTVDGFNFAIAGGGRYDRMIGHFCGQDVCACGFSIGFERIVTILKENQGLAACQDDTRTAFLIDEKLPASRKAEILRQASLLRQNGATVTVLPLKKNVKRQIESLSAEGYGRFEKFYE